MGKSHPQNINNFEYYQKALDKELEIHNSRCLGILYCPYCNRIERDRIMNSGVIPP